VSVVRCGNTRRTDVHESQVELRLGSTPVLLPPDLPNGYISAMGISELAMNAQSSASSMARVKGCGKTGQDFTLYHVNLFDGTGRAMSQGFKNSFNSGFASTNPETRRVAAAHRPSKSRPTESCFARTALNSLASHPSRRPRRKLLRLPGREVVV
jgi:hypothetical protein